MPTTSDTTRSPLSCWWRMQPRGQANLPNANTPQHGCMTRADNLPIFGSMTHENTAELRARARRFRERADRELHDPVVTEAFYQIANTLERRAAVSEAAVLDAPLGKA